MDVLVRSLPHHRSVSGFLVNALGRVELSSSRSDLSGLIVLHCYSPNTAVLRQARGPWLLWFPYAYLLSKLKKKSNKLLLFESKVSSNGLILSIVFLGDSGTLKRWTLAHKSLWEPLKGTEEVSVPSRLYFLVTVW